MKNKLLAICLCISMTIGTIGCQAREVEIPEEPKDTSEIDAFNKKHSYNFDRAGTEYLVSFIVDAINKGQGEYTSVEEYYKFCDENNLGKADLGKVYDAWAQRMAIGGAYNNANDEGTLETEDTTFIEEEDTNNERDTLINNLGISLGDLVGMTGEEIYYEIINRCMEQLNSTDIEYNENDDTLNFDQWDYDERDLRNMLNGFNLNPSSFKTIYWDKESDERLNETLAFDLRGYGIYVGSTEIFYGKTLEQYEAKSASEESNKAVEENNIESAEMDSENYENESTENNNDIAYEDSNTQNNDIESDLLEEENGLETEVPDNSYLYEDVYGGYSANDIISMTEAQLAKLPDDVKEHFGITFSIESGDPKTEDYDESLDAGYGKTSGIPDIVEGSTEKNNEYKEVRYSPENYIITSLSVYRGYIVARIMTPDGESIVTLIIEIDNNTDNNEYFIGVVKSINII